MSLDHYRQKIGEVIHTFLQENPEAYFYGEQFPGELCQKLMPFIKHNLTEEEKNLFIHEMSLEITQDIGGSYFFIKSLLNLVYENPDFLNNLLQELNNET